MKVLIVDDETIIRKGVGKLLRNCHKAITDILEAKNGSAALELIESGKPDLVVTDIRMPVMDGLQLAETVSARYPDIGIVVLTGYADFEYAQKALRFGVVDYVLKPVTQTSINEAVYKILQRNPGKWTEHLDLGLIREMKDTVVELVRNVLAEDREGVELLLAKWRQRTAGRKLTLLETKQLMGHFQLAYKAELLLHQPELPAEEQSLPDAPASLDDLFARWREYLLAQTDSISRKRVPRHKRIVDQTLREIKAGYGDPGLNIHQLAERAGVTSAYLSKMFREIMHKPITQHIADFRLEQARSRMEWDEETKINRIAEECGFSDYPYFSKVFKKTYGVSPQEYRDKYMS